VSEQSYGRLDVYSDIHEDERREVELGLRGFDANTS
jgi:hypothetical protein